MPVCGGCEAEGRLIVYTPPHSPFDQKADSKTCNNRGENADHHAEMLAGKLIRIHSRQPAKQHGKQEDEDQNLLGNFEERVFRLLVFLENGGNGCDKAETDKENDKQWNSQREFP